MKARRLISIFACAAIAMGSAAVLAEDAPKTEPSATTKPSDASPAETRPADAPKDDAKATISPDARKLIDEVAAAYSKLKSLEIVGTMTGDFDAGGRKETPSASFTSSYEAPNKFVFASGTGTKEAFQVGSTGEKAYLYDKNQNGYLQESAPKDKVATKDLPRPLPQILVMQNPSLQLALAKDPAFELTDGPTTIARGEDSKIGDVTYATLKMTTREGAIATVAIDPASHLIRQAVVDIRAMLEKQGVPDVKKAGYTLDYTTTAPDAATKAEQFAWAPPQAQKISRPTPAATTIAPRWRWSARTLRCSPSRDSMEKMSPWLISRGK